MNEIIEETYNLLDSLEKSPLLKGIKSLKESLIKDNSLLKDIELVRQLEDPKIKKKLYENPNYLEYNKLINELNHKIIYINHNLKNLIKNGKCNSESN